MEGMGAHDNRCRLLQVISRLATTAESLVRLLFPRSVALQVLDMLVQLVEVLSLGSELLLEFPQALHFLLSDELGLTGGLSLGPGVTLCRTAGSHAASIPLGGSEGSHGEGTPDGGRRPGELAGLGA